MLTRRSRVPVARRPNRLPWHPMLFVSYFGSARIHPVASDVDMDVVRVNSYSALGTRINRANVCVVPVIVPAVIVQDGVLRCTKGGGGASSFWSSGELVVDLSGYSRPDECEAGPPARVKSSNPE